MTSFRSYPALRLDLLRGGGPSSFVVLTGPNGAGKTNVLEAISLLSPGRGLRGADLASLRHHDIGSGGWGVAGDVAAAGSEPLRLGTGMQHGDSRRVIRAGGKTLAAQADLAALFPLLWLTPQMDRLFLDTPQARRKFLDRLVLAAHPQHAAQVSRYDKNLRQRLRLLTGDARADARWLDTLEQALAADAVAIAAARHDLLLRLDKYVVEMAAREPSFPMPQSRLTGWIDEAVAVQPALAVEEDMRRRFAASRASDAAAGKTLEGPQRSDWQVVYAAKNMPAAECSTGEQKGLLIALVLSHALMLRDERGAVPALLLDEVAAHLDADRRLRLFAQLQALGGQVFMTGTDAAIFDALGDHALRFTVDGGRVRAAPSAPRLEAV